MSAAPWPAPEEGRAAGRLQTASSWSFLLLVAALPWSIAAISVSLGLCAALTAAEWALHRPDWRATAPVRWPILGWLLALVLAAWFAQDRAHSLPRLGKGLLPLLSWVAAHHARPAAAGRRALAVWLGSAALAAAFGLALWIFHGAAFPERARGAVGHYMTFGGQLLLWLPVACGVALLVRRGRTRLAALAAAAIGFAALAATFTRSAWIGTAVSLAVLVGIARPRWLPALAIAGALLVALAPASYRDRLGSAFDPAHPANAERRHMWEAGGRMFHDHPLTGVGLMDLHPIYERYRDPAAKEGVGHLHSVFVQIAATMGVVGLLAFAALYTGLVRAAAAGLRDQLAGGGLAAGLRLGVAAALVGFLMAGFFEWNFGDEELLDLLYVMVGLAWAARAWPAEPVAAGERRAAGPAQAARA